ncbi:MAG: rRNA adenine N-6-methyltransferase family protein [Rhodospirillaceae bacterium]
MSQTEVIVADKAKGRKAPPAAWVFFQRWLANPLSMGSVVPSSIGLRNLISKHLVCGPDEVVVEFGGGTGAITRALLEAGVPSDRIWSIEIDPELASFLHQTYPDVNVIHGDCRETEKFIGVDLVGKVGTVVVGIPMVMLPHAIQKEVTNAIFRVLPKGRRFLLYTYCATSPLDMKKLGLKGKRLGWTPRNFPPASVWGYSKAE